MRSLNVVVNKIYFISKLNNLGVFKVVNKKDYHILKIIKNGSFEDYNNPPIHPLFKDVREENNCYFFSLHTYEKIINDPLIINEYFEIDFEYVFREYGNRMKRYEKFKRF